MERTEGVTKDDFLRDDTLTRACIRSLEVIGEAARRVPDDLKRRNSHVQWREMAGMRDHLIHGYFSVDYEIVWDAVTNKSARVAPRSRANHCRRVPQCRALNG